MKAKTTPSTKETQTSVTPSTGNANMVMSPTHLRRRIQKQFLKPSRTKQAFKDECDINKIVPRLEQGGALPNLIKQNPRYGDFADPMSYQDSMNLVLHAQEQFNALSSRVRERFNNDPVKFLEFTSNPSNIDEMIHLGLATRKNDDLNNDKKGAPTISESQKIDQNTEGSKK